MVAVQSRIRFWVVVTCAAGAIAGASGLSEQLLFAQPSELKYLLTVAVPLVAIVAISAEQPLLLLVPMVILVAPFGGFVAGFAGLDVSPLAVLLFVTAVAAVVTGPAPARLSAVGAATVAALLLLAIPLYTATDPAKSALVIATLVTTAWVVARAAAMTGGLRIVLMALVVSAAVQGALAIWEFRSGHRLDLYGTAGNQVFGADYFFDFGGKNRPTGSFSDPISLGNVLALSCPIALALALAARDARERWVVTLAGLVVGVALALSLSRMSWIAAAVGVLIALVLMPQEIRRKALIPLIAVALAAIVVASANGGSALDQRFSSILNPTASSVRTAQGDRQRVELWGAASAVASGHPVVGVGFDNLLPRLRNRVADVGPAGHAHSTFLQVAAEAGALGGLALLLVFVGVARDLAAGWRRQPLLVSGIAGGIAALFVTWLTDYTVRYTPVAAMFAVLFGAAASQGRHQIGR